MFCFPWPPLRWLRPSPQARSISSPWGATLGFTLLLVLIGLGLHELLLRVPALTRGLQLGGVAFLVYMAWKLAMDDGSLNAGQSGKRPTLTLGAVMQWLNPKAWLACVAGMGAFAANGDTRVVLEFALIYFVICYGSIPAGLLPAPSCAATWKILGGCACSIG